ncbi:MAG: glycerate kinase [Nitrospirota bacterium]|nr:glycerate kinase [Nitrospirota bacterium]
MESRASGELAEKIFHASLRAVDPYESVKQHTEKIRAGYRDGGFRRLVVTGFGKASYWMAKAMEDYMADEIDAGIVITKYGHVGMERLKKIQVLEAGHPVPDDRGTSGTTQVKTLLNNADNNTLVVCLISGGGSALLVSPYEGISLEDKQNITRLLLNAGADIYELNAVRKHISSVKGGRLAELADPAGIISLILSDVIGDRLDVIASGPTAPDKTSFSDAINILEKYRLAEKTARPVFDMLNRGARHLIPETPKDDNAVFENVENIIIGDNKKALQAAIAEAERLGLKAEIISTEIKGEAREAGKWLAKKAAEIRREKGPGPPLCLISGGETTVTVLGNGLGGRNMELALSFAIAIEGTEGITLLSAGTDGTDGPTDAAGAVVTGHTTEKAVAAGLDPKEYLRNNNTYNFFKKTGGLFVTGPTGTNVTDIQILIVK